jgi:hypothetical protein
MANGNNGTITEVINGDFIEPWVMFNDFIQEVALCQSANSPEVYDTDIERWLSYVSALEKKFDWIVAQPDLDLPKISPRLYALEPAFVPVSVENSMVDEVVRLFVAARDEFIQSNSNRRSTGFITHDEERVRAILEKIRTYINDYVTQVEPLDVPESSPAEPVTGPGRKKA